MNKLDPPLSVVMPVHNAREFLDESIKSIVNQTFADFEFVILDDGSTDGSHEILREWEHKDQRIRVLQSPRNLGLSRSSNLVASEARAPVLARMDADDVSHPDRLQRQLEVIESRPDVVAVGTLCDGIDAAGRVVRPRDRWRLVRRSAYFPFPHGSAMFRKKIFEAVEGYAEDFIGGEDQNFFFKMTRHGRVVTLSDVLYHYRYHSANATLTTGAMGVLAVKGRESTNGNDLAPYYMLGAMRLWSGQSPGILGEILRHGSLKWNLPTLAALLSASLGSVSPSTLRFLMRSLIRARDMAAGMHVKDGRAYEWRLD